MQAKDGQRPYLELSADWTITATPADSILTLDGLWVGTHPPRTIHLTADANCPWALTTIAHTTFDPGGLDADGAALGPIRVDRVDGHHMTIESCILGPVPVERRPASSKPRVRNSIVHPTDPAPTSRCRNREALDIRGCTVIGEMEAHRIEASELLCTDLSTSTTSKRDASDSRHSRRQRGAARLPVADTDRRERLFTSTRFGDPGYAQLSDVAPRTISRGGETAPRSVRSTRCSLRSSSTAFEPRWTNSSPLV